MVRIKCLTPHQLNWMGFLWLRWCEIQTRKEKIYERIEKPIASEYKRDFNNQRLGKYFYGKESHNLEIEVSPLSCISLGMN